MKIYVNDRNEIHGVGSTTDPTLTGYEVDDMFSGWSTAKICCYKVYLNDNKVTGYTPYVDSRIIEHIDQLGKNTEAITPYSASKNAYIDDSECSFEVEKKGVITCSCITDSGKAIPTTYEINGSTVLVKFDQLDEVATVSINIQ